MISLKCAITSFSKLALLLTILTQKSLGVARGSYTIQKEKSQFLDISKAARKTFYKLKNSFLKKLILAYFKRDYKTKIKVNISKDIILGILS